jgi:TRAP-type uncharacterized transport system substrate-binding protein
MKLKDRSKYFAGANNDSQMDNELLLLRRLIALHDERIQMTTRSKTGIPTLEQISKIENEIEKINRRLREYYGY